MEGKVSVTMDKNDIQLSLDLPTDMDQSQVEAAQHKARDALQATMRFLQQGVEKGSAHQLRYRENDELVERCLFKSMPGVRMLQDKTVQVKPDCSAWCYIRLKDKGKQAMRILTEQDEEQQHPLSARKRGKRPSVDPDEDNDDSRYRWAFLKNRYYLKARGAHAIEKHVQWETTAKAIHNLELQQEQTPPPIITRAEKLGMLSRRVPIPFPNYAQILPIDGEVASRLHRFEKHLIRIYGPTYNAFKRIPSLYADGSIQRTGWQIYESAINGDGLALGQRLAGIGYETCKKVLEGLNSGEGGRGLPPSLFPPSPKDGSEKPDKPDGA